MPRWQSVPVRQPTPSPVRDPSPRPLSPRPSPVRPQSPTRQPTPSPIRQPTPPPSRPSQTNPFPFMEDDFSGGNYYVSPTRSNDAPPTTGQSAGGAEEPDALTIMSTKLDRCLEKVGVLESELNNTKKTPGSVVLKLVARVKKLEGKVKKTKRRVIILDSEDEEASTKTYFDLEALTVSSSDKGKAPAVDGTSKEDLLSAQERALKNLHDAMLGEELARKVQAEEEANLARHREELAKKAQADLEGSFAQGSSLPVQRQREIDAASLLYTDAEWRKRDRPMNKYLYAQLKEEFEKIHGETLVACYDIGLLEGFSSLATQGESLSYSATNVDATNVDGDPKVTTKSETSVSAVPTSFPTVVAAGAPLVVSIPNVESLRRSSSDVPG
ncbi:hypothetical protein Tco_0608414 [Tanacetum coccineum]